MDHFMTKKPSNPLIFFVNGDKIVEEKADPEWTLLYYLRNKLRLVGSKEGCGEGGCGACTVMQSRYDHKAKKIVNEAVNACLTPLCSIHGTAIITVEGIGSIRKGLHPVQERIAKSHGSACGFCTPGFVMSMYALLRNTPIPKEHDIEDAFQGNLCRCTGYRPILEGFQTFCCKGVSASEPYMDGDSSFKNGLQCSKQGDKNDLTNENEIGPSLSKSKCPENCKRFCETKTQQIPTGLFDESEFVPYDPTLDMVFPPDLQQMDTLNESLKFVGPNVTWFRPCNLEDLLHLKMQYPNGKLVAGNTEVGVDVKYKKQFYSIYIQTSQINELSEISKDSEAKVVRVGSSVTLRNFEEFCKLQIQNQNRDGTVFNAIIEILKWFGGQQVRNAATIGGNLITASPISDLNPIFMATGCSANFVSSGNKRSVKIDENFFKSYRSTVIQPNEVLHSIEIPITNKDEYVWAAKQSRRREDDIAIVSTCMRVRILIGTNVTQNASLAFGGMGPVTRIAKTASLYFNDRKWDRSILENVASLLHTDLILPCDAPGGMVAYRQTLPSSFFYKFFLNVSKWLGEGHGISQDILHPKEISAMNDCQRGDSHGTQLFQIIPNGKEVHDLVGRPIAHLSALKHATGEATYTDDVPLANGELFGTLVLSTIACGTIVKIDAEAALKLPGVVAFFDASSISKESNIQGFLIDDEEIFASQEVTCQGQIIGYVIAQDPLIAEKASRLIHVEYKQKPAIITIEQAIEAGSFYTTKKISCGDQHKAFLNCEQILEGEMRIGGQEHFYMEPQSCIVTPLEGGEEMDVLISAQGLTYIQKQIARCLNLKEHRVKVRCRRMGGAFGGKETRSVIVAMATAVAAKKLNVPIRTIMNRHDDMVATGGRHPFLCRYKVGFTNQGKISVVKATMYSNAGNSLDGSPLIMERALLTFDSGYTIPNWELEGVLCKTNLPSNTAFRGFGGPQASIFCENIIDAVAETVGRPVFDIRELHLKQEGDTTPYGWKLENVTLQRCWRECVQNSNYKLQLEKVEKFNQDNRWKKRGISVMPMKHDLGFTAPFMNQAGALVMIYSDGSVGLNHAGTEMGQGLFTKMVQVAGKALGLPIEKIYHTECSTDKIPNGIPTCGSMSSDLNGMAIINACEKLLKRLEPFKKSNPDGCWEDWVSAAYFNRINLSATGFYEMGHISYDFDATKQKEGTEAFNYSVFGVACSMVEIDCWTGNHSVLRTDIVIDAGESLNPAVDIGQVEGAFLQGYGLFCMEELLYTPTGLMLTKGPGMYKIPSSGDIPREFNVSLLRGAKNPRAVYSSKGLGEPPLFLSASVYFAIKEAIKAIRRDHGEPTLFRFDCPATVERVRLACPNRLITIPAEADESENEIPRSPWAIIV